MGTKALGVYAVNYPATTDFRTAVDGINDARAHILATAAACPETKIVLGVLPRRSSHGLRHRECRTRRVADMAVPAPMPLEVADHVAAVALFGKPSARFMRAINDPQIVIGPRYVDKTIDLCVEDDLVCDPDGRSFGVHSRYPEVGMANEGATLAANKLQAIWEAEAAAETPATETPESPEPSAPALLSAIAGQPDASGSTPATRPPPGPVPVPSDPAPFAP